METKLTTATDNLPTRERIAGLIQYVAETAAHSLAYPETWREVESVLRAYLRLTQENEWRAIDDWAPKNVLLLFRGVNGFYELGFWDGFLYRNQSQGSLSITPAQWMKIPVGRYDLFPPPSENSTGGGKVSEPTERDDYYEPAIAKTPPLKSMTPSPSKTEVRRYRMSYRDGIREDDGTIIFPADASKPMVLAEEHDRLVSDLRQQLAEARKDQERLDWTDNNLLASDLTDAKGFAVQNADARWFYGDTFRAAIDTASAKPQRGGEE